MNQSRLALTLTTINLVLMAGLVAERMGPSQAFAESPEPPPALLRGTGLEIVDAQGRVRALLAVQPPATVDGKNYPETVLLRLVDPESGPVVKLTAARDGSALTLSDDAEGGVQLFARDTGSFMRVQNAAGQEAMLKP